MNDCEKCWDAPCTCNSRDNFTLGELKAIRLMIDVLKVYEKEDVIGTILKTGAFHHLADDDEAVVRLSRKLEATPEELDTLKIARAKHEKKLPLELREKYRQWCKKVDERINEKEKNGFS